MRSRQMRFVGAAALGLLSSWEPAAAQTHKIGLYFDAGASVCTAEVVNFAPPVRAYIFAMAPAGTVLNGALVSLALPNGLVVSNVEAAKDATLGEGGTLGSSNGVEITLQKCPVAAGPELLMSFDLHQADGSLPSDARLPNVLLELKGGVSQLDSLRYDKPQLKICPDDPINGTPVFVTAVPIRSTLNCDSDCPCTTPIRVRTWADVKRQFRGR